MDVGLLPGVPDGVEHSAVDLVPSAMVSSSTSIRQRSISCHLVTSKGAVLVDADFSVMVAPSCPPGRRGRPWPGANGQGRWAGTGVAWPASRRGAVGVPAPRGKLRRVRADPGAPFRFGGGDAHPPPRERLPAHATKRLLKLGGRICHLNLAGVLS